MTVAKKAVKKAAPRPPAKPGDKGYDWAKEYSGEDFVLFEASNGTVVGLAAAKGDRKLKPGDFRKMMHMEDWQQNFYLIEKICSPTALALTDEFEDEDYAEMIKAWTEWSGKEAGES